MTARSRGDEGQVLGLALGFLTFVALVVAATLTAATAQLHATQTFTQQRDERYAAEAGVLAAAQQIQAHPTLGTDPQAPDACGFHPGAGFMVNSMTVDVTCSPKAGSGTGPGAANRPPYSLLALTHAGAGGNEGIIDVDGGGSDVKVLGPNGSSGVCPPSLSCDQIADPVAADPGYAPLTTPAPGLAPPPTCGASAAIFRPGRYRRLPQPPAGCNKPWLFQANVSGPPSVFYFDFTNNGSHLWTINNTVIGGTPRGWDPTVAGSVPTLPGACKTELDLAPNSGVQFVFGGDSRLAVSSTGKLEVCAQPSANQQQIAIYGMTANASPTQQPNETPLNVVSATTPAYDVSAISKIDGTDAEVSIPATGNASVGLSGFPAVPQGALIANATLIVAHHEDPGLQSVTLDVGDSAGVKQSFNVPQRDSDAPPDSFDVTSLLIQNPTLTTDLHVGFTATAPVAGGPFASAVDGIELDLTLAPAPGGYRAITGCAQLTLGSADDPQQPCPLISSAQGAALYVQGTVYAPTAGIDVFAQPTDPVAFNRGVIARMIVFRGHPGGTGPEGVTAGGAFNRFVTLNATVNNHLRISTSVSFDDVQALLTGEPPKITYNTWEVK